MKKIIWLPLLCVLFSVLTACGGTGNQAAPPEDSTPPQTQTEPPEVLAAPEPEDVQPVKPAPSEEPPETAPEQATSEEPAIPQTGGSAMLAAYAGILEEMRDRFAEWKNPNDQLADNHFAIFDIDGDGEEELVTEFCTGWTPGTGRWRTARTGRGFPSRQRLMRTATGWFTTSLQTEATRPRPIRWTARPMRPGGILCWRAQRGWTSRGSR